LVARHLRVSVPGAIGTVLVHVLLIIPFVADVSLPERRPSLPGGAGAITAFSKQNLVMTVVFINEPTTTPRVDPLKPEQLTSRGVAPPDLPLVVLSPDPLPASEAPARSDQATAEPAAPSDPAQHALLYGRYLDQIQARIERAWMRPRTAIGATKFSCRARIEQDSRGYVAQIRLNHCNGAESWQQSLMSAIRTASPLPAPPDPSVYADRLWLSFESAAFDPAGSAQGFEPAPRVLLAADEPVADLPKRFAQEKSPVTESNAIRLTIIGDRTYVSGSTSDAKSPNPAGTSPR
jgi:hypothetical protein